MRNDTIWEKVATVEASKKSQEGPLLWNGYVVKRKGSHVVRKTLDLQVKGRLRKESQRDGGGSSQARIRQRHSEEGTRDRSMWKQKIHRTVNRILGNLRKKRRSRWKKIQRRKKRKKKKKE